MEEFDAYDHLAVLLDIIDSMAFAASEAMDMWLRELFEAADEARTAWNAVEE